MIILFADPGGTTGWCAMEWDGSSEIRPTLLLADETPGDEFPLELMHLLADGELGVDVVGYENFRIYKGTNGPQALPVIEQIGAIKWVCGMAGVPFVGQAPAKKQFFEKKLKSLGYYQVARPHANDAIMHALAFFMERGSEGRTPAWVLGALPV